MITIIEMDDDTSRVIAYVPDINDAERLVGALRAVRNELSQHTKGEYGIGSLTNNAFDWELGDGHPPAAYGRIRYPIR